MQYVMNFWLMWLPVLCLHKNVVLTRKTLVKWMDLEILPFFVRFWVRIGYFLKPCAYWWFLQSSTGEFHMYGYRVTLVKSIALKNKTEKIKYRRKTSRYGEVYLWFWKWSEYEINIVQNAFTHAYTRQRRNLTNKNLKTITLASQNEQYGHYYSGTYIFQKFRIC